MLLLIWPLLSPSIAIMHKLMGKRCSAKHVSHGFPLELTTHYCTRVLSPSVFFHCHDNINTHADVILVRLAPCWLVSSPVAPPLRRLLHGACLLSFAQIGSSSGPLQCCLPHPPLGPYNRAHTFVDRRILNISGTPKQSHCTFLNPYGSQ